jgi:HTH-type transcriptional regulator / antitoxin HipB
MIPERYASLFACRVAKHKRGCIWFTVEVTERSLLAYVTVRSLYIMSPFGYSEAGWPMRIRTPRDLGSIIRERRIELGMEQGALAEKAGTSRKWIVEVEQGKPRAEIGLILRTLKALEVSIDLASDTGKVARSSSESTSGDINSILNSLKRTP